MNNEFKKNPALREWYRVFTVNGSARREFSGGRYWPFTKLAVGDKLHIPYPTGRGALPAKVRAAIAHAREKATWVPGFAKWKFKVNVEQVDGLPSQYLYVTVTRTA